MQIRVLVLLSDHPKWSVHTNEHIVLTQTETRTSLVQPSAMADSSGVWGGCCHYARRCAWKLFGLLGRL